MCDTHRNFVPTHNLNIVGSAYINVKIMLDSRALRRYNGFKIRTLLGFGPSPEHGKALSIIYTGGFFYA
jgi:hypothetical protein